MVNDAISQWYLRPDNYQFNPLFLGYLSQPLYIIRANIQVMGNLSCAGIAWGCVNLLSFRALGQLPD